MVAIVNRRISVQIWDQLEPLEMGKELPFRESTSSSHRLYLRDLTVSRACGIEHTDIGELDPSVSNELESFRCVLMSTRLCIYVDCLLLLSVLAWWVSCCIAPSLSLT